MFKKGKTFILVLVLIVVLLLILGLVFLILNYSSKKPTSQEVADRQNVNLVSEESLQQQFFGIQPEKEGEQIIYIQTTEEKPPLPPE